MGKASRPGAWAETKKETAMFSITCRRKYQGLIENTVSNALEKPFHGASHPTVFEYFVFNGMACDAILYYVCAQAEIDSMKVKVSFTIDTGEGGLININEMPANKPKPNVYDVTVEKELLDSEGETEELYIWDATANKWMRGLTESEVESLDDLDPEIEEHAKTILLWLCNQKDGFETNTFEICHRILRLELNDSDLFDLDYALGLMARKEGLELDRSHHDGMVEGLPYNLNFYVRKRI